ncbi:MAG TPA: isoprenylcysteine carboxylmethyltransferase family protein [Anaerolineales bacterium]|nr:isoprenylcysteine carboxylmethyltransferase family protein [Anaerolineales bacterium]
MLPFFIMNHTAEWFFYAAFIIWLAPEMISSYVIRVDPKAKVNDRNSSLVLSVCIWLSVFLGVWIAYLQTQFTVTWEGGIVFSIGIVLMLTGVVFRWYSISILGKYFSQKVAVRPGQKVIQDGPYRLIRHPSYSGSILTMFGAGLAFTNWLSLVAVMVLALIGYGYRIWVEEMTLISELGEPYREYMKHTKRIIPFII